MHHIVLGFQWLGNPITNSTPTYEQEGPRHIRSSDAPESAGYPEGASSGNNQQDKGGVNYISGLMFNFDSNHTTNTHFITPCPLETEYTLLRCIFDRQTHCVTVPCTNPKPLALVDFEEVLLHVSLGS